MAALRLHGCQLRLEGVDLFRLLDDGRSELPARVCLTLICGQFRLTLHVRCRFLQKQLGLSRQLIMALVHLVSYRVVELVFLVQKRVTFLELCVFLLNLFTVEVLIISILELSAALLLPLSRSFVETLDPGQLRRALSVLVGLFFELVRLFS